MFKTSEPLYNGELMSVQDKRAFVQRRANVLNILYTAEESCTEEYGSMTNHQIYFSGLTRFVHTCLGLICEIWMLF